MSDTPKTDEEVFFESDIHGRFGTPDSAELVSAWFARELERENAKLASSLAASRRYIVCLEKELGVEGMERARDADLP